MLSPAPMRVRRLGVMSREVVPDLGGARPIDVLRLRGNAEVFDALDAEEQGVIG